WRRMAPRAWAVRGRLSLVMAHLQGKVASTKCSGPWLTRPPGSVVGAEPMPGWIILGQLLEGGEAVGEQGLQGRLDGQGKGFQRHAQGGRRAVAHPQMVDEPGQKPMRSVIEFFLAVVKRVHGVLLK